MRNPGYRKPSTRATPLAFFFCELSALDGRPLEARWRLEKLHNAFNDYVSEIRSCSATIRSARRTKAATDHDVGHDLR